MMKKKRFLLLEYDDKKCLTGLVNATARALHKQKQSIIIIDMVNSLSLYDFFFRYIVFSRKNFFSYSFNIIRISACTLPIIHRWQWGYRCSMKATFFIIRMLLFLFDRSSEKIVWFIHPHIAYMADVCPSSYKVLYDITDYYTSPIQKIRKTLFFDQQKLFARSDYVFSIMDHLVKKYKKIFHRKIIVVPQGCRLHVDTPHISYHRKKNHKPIIGFVGGINERLDMKILIPLIQRNPQWQFTFVGPKNHEIHVEMPKEDKFQTLLSFPNVNHISRQPLSGVARLIQTFDICMIPYDITQEFNKHCHPMKLFEYFAFGKPVVSTPIEELRRFSTYVYRGKNWKEWEHGIQTILRHPYAKHLRLEEQKLARENSFDNKIAMILEHL